MTEQEFQTQVWRPYDRITTAEGVPGKVLGVSFSSKSVRAFISGAPEWVKCELIETHTTAKGGECDDAAIIEELHNKVLNQATEIDRLRDEKEKLTEKINRNYLKDLLTAVNTIQQGLIEKKSKMEKVERGINLIMDTVSNIKDFEE